LEYTAEGLKIADDKVDFRANESNLEFTVPLDGKAVPFPEIPGARADRNSVEVVENAAEFVVVIPDVSRAAAANP
jgi:hypothetical protein